MEVPNAVVRSLLRVGWRWPFARVLAPRRPVIVLYHGVPAGAGDLDRAVFEQHVRFLKQNFAFVSPHDAESPRHPHDRIRLLLTFDDGFRNNAEVVAPILRDHQVPALFFVSSRHAAPGRYLWFSHLQALEKSFPGDTLSFRGQTFEMSPAGRRQSIERLQAILLGLRPHPSAMYQALETELPHLEEFVSRREVSDRYAGMTAEQIAELSADPLFSIGAHTIDHPFLTRCESLEALHQIQGNQAWLEAVCGRRCDAIAYPSGDYDADVLDACSKAGFTRGYAVSTRIDSSSPLEQARLGIYSTSTDVLGFKVQWGHLMRDLLIPVG